MRRLIRIGVPIVCVAGALSLLPAGSASAAGTLTSSCTRQVLLLPGATVSCGTPVVVCPAPDAGTNGCLFSATTSAGAAVGVAIGGKVTQTVTATEFSGEPFTLTKTGSCASALAVLSGCTGQTPVQSGVASGLFGSFTFSGSGQAVCVWTGGPIAVLATLSCTEKLDYALNPPS